MRKTASSVRKKTLPKKGGSLSGKPASQEPVLGIPQIPVRYRWITFLAGAALTWIGYQLLRGFRPNWGVGIPVHLAAAFLLYQSFPRQVSVPAEWRVGVETPGAKGKKKKAGSSKRSLTLAAWWILGLLVLGQVLFRVGAMEAAWAFSVVALGIVIWAARQGWPGKGPVSVLPWGGGAALGAVLLAALAVRLAFVWTNVTGLQADEANNLQDAYAVSVWFYQSPFVTGWGGTPTFPDFIVGGAFRLLGPELWVARAISALFSMATLWFFFRWCRFWMGEWASLLATFLFGFSWWFLYFSLSPYHNSILLMTEVAALYFLEKGFRGGARLDFGLAGLMAAASAMNYVPGRGVCAMMALIGLGYLAIRGFSLVRTYWSQVLLCVTSFFWLLGPFLYHAAAYPGEVWGRVVGKWIAQEAQRTGGYFFLAKAYGWTFSSLLGRSAELQADSRFTSGDPFLDPLVSAALLLGVALCFVRWRRPLNWVLFSGLFLGISANALGIQASPAVLSYVHSIRLSTVIPFVFLGAAAGLEWFLALLGELGGRARALGLGGLGLALILSLWVNVPVIAHDFQHTRSTWGEKGFGQIEESKVLNDSFAKANLMVESDARTSAVYFLTQNKSKFNVFDGDPQIPILNTAARDVMLLFEPWRLSDKVKARIRETYPGATWSDLKTPWGDDYLTSVLIPHAQILEAQEGMKLKDPLL